MFMTAQGHGPRRPLAASYREVNASTAIEGATPHKLVSLLYASVSSEIAAARGAISRSDIAEKGRAIAHAVRIVEEGLLAPLDMKAGGPLAQNLSSLYEYLVHRLTMANLETSDSALAECSKLMEVLREGWDGIADKLPGPMQAAA